MRPATFPPPRIASVIAAAATIAIAGLLGAPPASAAPALCVGGSGCYPTVQAAVDAAPAGATVRVGAGTFAGGISIGKSLTLVGAGASRTTLTGGDHVVKVLANATGPQSSVTIADLRLTGGDAHGDERPSAAFGGGLFVDGLDDTVAPGATVVVRGAIIEGNRVEATGTTTYPGYDCPGGLCPFALSAGGGIASFGTLTVDHSIVRDNAATGRVSDADGGGIFTARGRTTVVSSTVTGNRTEPLAIGRFAEGGGLFAGDADESDPTLPITITDSVVSGNRSILATSWPVHPSADSDEVIDESSNAGGVHIGGGWAATIDRTVIDGNAATAIDPAGEPYAIDGGLIQAGVGSIAITRSSVSHNSTRTVAATADDVGPSGTALEVDGTATISDTAIAGNTAEATGTAGSASDSNGLAVFSFDGSAGTADLTRATVVGNTATAKTSTGTAKIVGAGVLNNSAVTMTDSLVAKNSGTATSPDAVAQGGGIFNGVLLSGPPVALTLHRTAVTGNAVSAPGGSAQGGGVYQGSGDGVTLSLDHAVVAGNTPDQVFRAPVSTVRSLATKAAPVRDRPHTPKY